MNFNTSSNLASIVVKSTITLFEYVGPSNIMALPSGWFFILAAFPWACILLKQKYIYICIYRYFWLPEAEFVSYKFSTCLLKSLSRSGRVDKIARADCITSIRSINSCTASWRSVIMVLRQDGLQIHSRNNLKIHIFWLIEYTKEKVTQDSRFTFYQMQYSNDLIY